MATGPWDVLPTPTDELDAQNVTQLKKALRRIKRFGFFAQLTNLLSLVGLGTVLFLLATMVHLGVAIVLGVLLSPVLVVVAANVAGINLALKARKAAVQALLDAINP